MKLEEGKLTLTTEELDLVKRANRSAGPSTAGMFLLNYIKNKNLNEGVETENHDVRFYTECILAYRRKQFEVK